ncbi:MAG: hypothetical protein V3R41_06395 [Gammaproteobacteria bacterium]
MADLALERKKSIPTLGQLDRLMKADQNMVSEVKEIGTTPKGATIFVADCPTGNGRIYYTDSAGCGHEIWQTGCTSLEDLELAIAYEKGLKA